MEEKVRRSSHSWNELVEREEALVWLAFYRRCRNPSIAQTLIEQLDQDAELKGRHAALYLRCVQTMVRHEERQDRAQHNGGLIRRLLDLFCLAPWRWLGERVGYLAMILVASCVPYQEPAKAQLRKVQKPKTRSAAARYTAASGGKASAAGGGK